MTPSDLHLLSEHRLVLARLLARYRPHCLIAGLCLAAGFCLLSLDLTDVQGVAFWAGMIILLGLPWLVPALLAYVRSIKAVRLYEEGMAWTARGQLEWHAWDEVREIYRADRLIHLFWHQTELTLVFKKMQPLVLDQSLSDFFALATLVEAIVTQRRLPQYRQALDEGGAPFGPILLKRNGLRINDHDFTWEQVEQYIVHDGGIIVTPYEYEDYTGEYVGLRRIPNYLVLLRLLDEMGKPAAPLDRSIFLHGRRPQASADDRVSNDDADADDDASSGA